MTRYNRTWLLIAIYIFVAVTVGLDLFIWRPH